MDLYKNAAAWRDVAYGNLPYQRLDWLSCGRSKAPTFVFIHGGCWQTFNRQDFAFIAAGPLAHGFDVVLPDFTLAPEATMTEIVGEIRLLLDFLETRTGEIGFEGKPVCLCGHSAGGQLAALCRTHPAVTLTLSISALFDLEPISLSGLDEKLRLTPDEVRSYSPVHQIGPGVPAIVAVGAAELPELVRQSQDYAASLRGRAQDTTLLTLAGHTHFSILDDLADPEGALMCRVEAAFAPGSRS